MIRGDIKIQLLSEISKIPEKGTINSAGYDLSSIEEFELKSMDRHLFKTGIKMSIPIGIYGRIAPRSGLAFKSGIDVMAGVIDSDYRGEISVLLINLSTENKKINIGDKIAQMIFESYNDFRITTTNNLDDTIRGSGGFGSTTITERKIEAPKEATSLIDKWKEVGAAEVPVPQKYESIAKEREKLIP